MVVYDPRQKPSMLQRAFLFVYLLYLYLYIYIYHLPSGLTTPGHPSTASPLPSSSAASLLSTSGMPTVPTAIPKTLPPALAAFIASLPPADGNII